MDKLLTVTQVSHACGVSARMLRYYEKEGLIASRRVEGYAYRVYTPENVNRLVNILVLRKLRIPLKDIAILLQEKDPSRKQAVYCKHISDIDQEMTVLETIRGILRRLADHTGDPALLLSPEITTLTDALAPLKTNLKEDTIMSEINNTQGCTKT